jgi:hypothetical protein
MTIGHATAVRTVVADAVVDAVDGGSGAGLLRFYTAAYATTICTITLADPAFGAASSGAAALNSVPLEGTCVAGGTISKFRFLTSDGTEILNGDVSTAGADINLNQTTMVTNDVVRITGITYNAAL